MLAVLAGAFIGLGALMSTLVAGDASPGFAASRLRGGLVFSRGLVLVVVASAELFTGNNLIAMAWASGRVSSREMLRNWPIAFAGNLVGAVGLALLAWLAGRAALNHGAVGEAVTRIAIAKLSCPWSRRFSVACCAMCWFAWPHGWQWPGAA